LNYWKKPGQDEAGGLRKLKRGEKEVEDKENPKKKNRRGPSGGKTNSCCKKLTSRKKRSLT